MSYDVIPLVGTFNDSRSYENRKISVSFIDNGLEDTNRDGLNTDDHSFSVSEYLNQASKDTLEIFLRDRRGVTPFLYQPFLDDIESQALYTCSEYEFEYIYIDLYLFNANFEKVNRLYVPI